MNTFKPGVGKDTEMEIPNPTITVFITFVMIALGGIYIWSLI